VTGVLDGAGATGGGPGTSAVVAESVSAAGISRAWTSDSWCSGDSRFCGAGGDNTTKATKCSATDPKQAPTHRRKPWHWRRGCGASPYLQQ
jgi:hypothetical protein